MKNLIIFDDTVAKSEIIEDVIGDRGFADVVVKRQTLYDKFVEDITAIIPDNEVKLITSHYEYRQMLDKLRDNTVSEAKVLHFFSNHIIADKNTAELTFDKLRYVDDKLLIADADNPVAVMFGSIGKYVDYLSAVVASDNESMSTVARDIEAKTCIGGIINIGKVENFIQCITGNFDARYFNSLQGDEYTIVKTSTNKAKIKAEYNFWHLLPEDMKFWFVEPFNYQETEDRASYTMERLHMTDLAIKWVHGSIDCNELEVILDKYFYFFNHRHARPVSKDEYKLVADALYIGKVRNRVAELKRMPQYEKIATLLTLNDMDMDNLVDRYIAIKDKIEGMIPQEPIAVIGHGDPCFANTMYNKATRTLKFIDPKGAISEDDLWTNPYYDLAKLSHSICGRYDFFNNALFEIKVNQTFESELAIDFDNEVHKQVFKKKVEENGYNYWLVRVYEASLFISMLPLHIDNPHKVYGFILNAANILQEIEDNV